MAPRQKPTNLRAAAVATSSSAASSSAVNQLVEDHQCEICGEWAEEIDTLSDPLVSCDSCGMWVHCGCYGVRHLHAAAGVAAGKAKEGKGGKKAAVKVRTYEDDDDLGHKARKAAVEKAQDNRVGAFTCLLCLGGHGADDAVPECLICQAGSHIGSNRALKPVVKDDPSKPSGKQIGWAHVTCAMWTPETFFWRPTDKDDIGGLETIPSKRKALKCAVCLARTGKSGGAPIQCTHGSCGVAFHALCARDVGWEMTVIEHNGGILMQSYCGAHSSLAHLKGAAANDAACQGCGSASDPDSMLLCDSCDDGYHMECLQPPLTSVPDGDWDCPTCCTVKKAGDSGSSRGGAAGSSASSGVGDAEEDEIELLPVGTKRARSARLTNDYFSNSRKLLATSDAPLPPSIPTDDLSQSTGAGVANVARRVISNLIAFLPLAQVRRVTLITGCGDLMIPAAALAASLGDTVAVVHAQLTPEVQAAECLVVARGPDTQGMATFEPLVQDALRSPAEKIVIVCDCLAALASVKRLVLLGDYVAIDCSNTETPFRKEPEDAGTSKLRQETTQGTAWVLKSLTPNHRGILRLVLENTDAKRSSIGFAKLLESTSSAMLASTEGALKNHLVELVDHGIIERRGVEISLKLPRQDVEQAISGFS